jgi:hypothetical protein
LSLLSSFSRSIRSSICHIWCYNNLC